jgi:hypothetical protein
VGLIDVGETRGFHAAGLRVVPPLPEDAIVPVVGDAVLQRRICERLDAVPAATPVDAQCL